MVGLQVSVKARLLLSFMALTTVILLILGILMVSWYQEEQIHRLDTFLVTEANGIVQSLAAFFDPDPPPKVLTQAESQQYLDSIKDYFSFRVNRQLPYKTTLMILGPDGGELVESNQAIDLTSDAILRAGEPRDIRDWGNQTTIMTLDAGITVFRMVSMPIVVNKTAIGSLRLACLWEPVSKALTDFRNGILLVLSLIALTNLLLGFFFISQALLPVRRMNLDVAQITKDNLHRRILVPPGKDELGELAATFNTMLERIDDAYRFQETLVADLSHQLRTPLAVMRGSVELALRRPPDQVEYRLVLEDSLVDIDRMGSFLETMLHLARLDNRNFHLNRQPENLLDLLCSAVEELEPLWTERSITVRYQIKLPGVPLIVERHDGAILPELRRNTKLTAPFDRFQMFQVGINILNNAWRHSPIGGIIDVDITILESPGLPCRVTIRNQGDPIPESRLEAIFDRFVRGVPDQTKSEPGLTQGFGLGLSIARRIMALHHGSIRAYNVETGGVAFELTLPSLPLRIA
jgi:signal transduction histidine kinase